MTKRKALLLALLMAVSMMISFVGCKKTQDESELPTQGPTETEPSETTPPATEPTEDYKNDIVYYPFPLLDMTYEEIMNKYPDAVVEGGPQGTVRLTCDKLPEITVIFCFDSDNAFDKIENPLPSDLKPNKIETTGQIYPGIQVGMKYGEINFNDIPNHEFRVFTPQSVLCFKIYEVVLIESYTINVYIGEDLPWEIVEKYLGYDISQQEVFNQVINGGEIIQPEDILNWLQDGHMEEIADIEISSIEIRRQD